MLPELPKVSPRSNIERPKRDDGLAQRRLASWQHLERLE